jgi:DNA repair protein RadC
MMIRHLPEHERPRERLLREGAAALSDAELLAVILRTGMRGCSAIELAARLIRDKGGLAPLLAASIGELSEAPGMGPAKAAPLLASLELARRAMGESWRRGATLRTPIDCATYLRLWLAHRPHEVFACLFLDSRSRVIACEELFRGSLDTAEVHPREVVRRALLHNAASLILAHNHPSGVTEPSEADLAITRRLVGALSLIQVRIVDHFIVGEGPPVSLAARGLL